jgi:hypothetical protein
MEVECVGGRELLPLKQWKRVEQSVDRALADAATFMAEGRSPATLV